MANATPPSAGATPLVSILIPTHNRPDYGEEALRSALAQTWGNVEIVVSDNSDDERTRERFAPYVAAHPNIHYLRAPGLSPMDNFNNCFQAAQGEFLSYLMDDDLFHPTKIERMMGAMLGNPAVGLVTSFRQLIDAAGQPIAQLPGTERLFETDTLIGGDSLGVMMLTNGNNLVGEPTTAIFRRSVIGARFGIFLDRQYVTLSDVATWLQVLSSSDCIYLPEALSYFRIHGGQDQQRGNVIRIQANVEWLQLLCDAIVHGKFIGRIGSARDLLIGKLTTLLVYLTSVHEDVERAYDLEKIQAVVRQAVGLLLGTSGAAAIPSDTLAGWSVVRVMQEVDAQRDAWNDADRIALYVNWLASGPHGDAVAGHYNLGTLYHNSGEATAAEAQYRAALQLADMAEARYALGVLLEQSGRLDDAVNEWEALLPAPGADASPLALQALAHLIDAARRRHMDAELLRYLALGVAFQPDQPALRAELDALRAAVDAPAAGAHDSHDGAVIYVVAVCFNEAAILPFFLDHYINFLGAKKVVLHDGGSTDGTAEIAARYPEVELVVKVSEKLDDRELMAIRNEEWKKYRDDCDWMVVCDVDEFVYHPQLRAKLAEFKRDGVTLPMVEGFEMLSKEHPRHVPGRYIWERIQTGTPNPQYYNKNLIFDPKIEINYLLGCHTCAPTGPVKRSEGFVFRNLHYRMLSHDHIVQKSLRAAARLSDWNKQTNAGFHYRQNAVMPRADYNRMFVPAFNVVAPRRRPALQRPVFAPLVQHLIALDHDAVCVELGTDPANGSTELLAWYVHSYGGSLVTVEPEALLRRDAAHGLRTRLLGRNVTVAAPGEPVPASIDLLVCNAADYRGDADDRARCRQAALDAFAAIEPQLSAEAVVVLDGIEDIWFGGKFQLLVTHLRTRGYAARNSGRMIAFSKTPLKTN
jgi:glycosyltransferase involved in cell wall biosynthesis